MSNLLPCIPENAPFTTAQRMWLNGYLAGLFSQGGVSSAATAQKPRERLLVIYGSQTGTAEGLAKKAAKQACESGFDARAICMEQHGTINWVEETRLLLITSTYGDGEPPDNARGFWEWLCTDSAPRMKQLHFSVLALGDTNYPAFCEFGKQCDARLEALGAHRIHARVDCDTDYEAPAMEWLRTALAAFASLAGKSAAPSANAIPTPSPVEEGYGKRRPFPAKLLRNERLSSASSAKEVRHYELSLEGSGLAYEAGDALGVWPANDPVVVERILESLGCDGEEAVQVPGIGETPLRLALTKHFDITKPTKDLLQAAAARSQEGELCAILARGLKDELQQWLWGRDVSDVLVVAGAPFAPEELLSLLRKMAPRLYSISSSPKAHPGEVHLTVGTVRYKAHGLPRGGVCSTFLADRVGEHGQVPVFIQASHGFKLPTDHTRPIIMVGPGTGIAPFRAFLEERQVIGATGSNWLFFGDQRKADDFLYSDTLHGWSKDGHLRRLDLAFSRDQEEKIYVQHRMLEAAAELWRWLQDGAYFYVCGDASRMAKDVDTALHRIVEQAGGMSADAAAAYVAKLRDEKRYLRDVY